MTTVTESVTRLVCAAFDPGTGVPMPLAEALELLDRVKKLERDAAQAALEPKAAPTPRTSSAPDKLPAKGPGAAKKQEIYARARQFRDDRDPDVYDRLSKCSNGALTAREIMKMVCGSVAPLAKWETLAAAMDALEREEETNT